MKPRNPMRILIVLTTFFSLPSLAQAENATPAASTAPKIQVADDLPPERWVPYSEGAIQEMRETLSVAMGLLGEARRSNDAVRLNCVNEKVTQMKGVMRVAEDAFLALQEATAINDQDRARAEVSKIRIARTKLQEALTGANTCAGAEASYTGGTQVELEIDPALGGADKFFGESGESGFFMEAESGEAGRSSEGGDSKDLGDSDTSERSRPPVVSQFESTADGSERDEESE